MTIFASSITNTIFTLVIVVVMSFLTYILYLRAVRESKRLKDENSIILKGVFSKSEMNSLIATYIDRHENQVDFSLIYLELDNFLDFESNYGKEESIRLLKDSAQRIKDILPKDIYLGKYAHDGFLLFVTNQHDYSKVLEFSDLLHKTFNEKVLLFGEEEINLTASIAVVQYPNHGENVEQLVNNLKLSIYQIVKNGGNDVKVYTKANDENQENMKYYYEIKKAIENQDFIVDYTPIVNSKSNNKIIGYDTLLTWDHPEHGIIKSSNFLKILSQSGDVHRLGLWKLTK